MPYETASKYATEEKDEQEAEEAEGEPRKLKKAKREKEKKNKKHEQAPRVTDADLAEYQQLTLHTPAQRLSEKRVTEADIWLTPLGSKETETREKSTSARACLLSNCVFVLFIG